MALYYNLAKVYDISESDQEFVLQIAELFVIDIPQDMIQLKLSIDNKDYKTAYAFAHKIKPTLDLFGMTVAVEETICIENWTKNQGKRREIIETYKNLHDRITKAVKEISKNLVPHLIPRRDVDGKAK